MSVKHIILIILLGFLAYANTLSNGFVADDNQLLVQNTFYRSWDNFPRLFSIHSGIRDTIYYTQETTDKGSINPSFRLIDKLSFFADYASFKLEAWGYHLTNLGIHLFNAALLYIILCELMAAHLALCAAGLFAVHPIFAEAVANISFRGDLLATMFVLLSVYAWINFARDYKDRGYYYGSLLCAALAFLTKESAAALPAVIFMYQWIYRRKQLAFRFQSMFWLLLGGYLYVYWYVYPPSLWSQSPGQVSLALNITGEYIKSFFLPDGIYPLPPRHAPAEGLWGAFLIVAAIGTVCFYISRKSKEAAFFIGWMVIFYLPVANIMALLNPMAYRFVYLPAIGLCVVSVLVIDHFFKGYWKRSKVPAIVVLALAAFLIYQTVGLNSWFKSNRTLAYAWSKYYPQNPWGYFFLGQEYLAAREYKQARATFEEGFKHGLRDPLALHYWAQSTQN